MRTSKHQGSLRGIVIEAVGAAVAAIGLASMLAPSGIGLGTLAPHPVWLAVLVVAARYGGRGLAVALPVGWGALMICGLGQRIAPALVMQRLSTGAELGAFAAAVMVGWIGSTHERRQADTQARLAALEQRCAADQAALAELQRSALILRARADRLDTSLTFLRDVASRLFGRDPDAAAQAALDLATARLGARAAVVQVMGEAGLAPLASVGVWTPDGPAAGVADDRTAVAVARMRRPMRAVDLPDAGPGDSDLAAPILSPRGALIGVLAVRGVPQGGASAAALRDLAVIASWSAAALLRAEPEHDASAEVAAAALEVDAVPEDGEEETPRSISQLNA